MTAAAQAISFIRQRTRRLSGCYETHETLRLNVDPFHLSFGLIAISAIVSQFNTRLDAISDHLFRRFTLTSSFVTAS
ncbi:MAG: hypothetical protein ABSD98_14710 [Candidatus Korobacteraceae bacterium]|jgi:hypothetical protein